MTYVIALTIVTATVLHAEETKKIDFHPRPKVPAANSVREETVPDRVCLFNEKRFQITNDLDEQACSAKGGHVQLTSGQTVGLPNIKDAPLKDTSFNDHMKKMLQPPPTNHYLDEDKKVRGAVHYDPLEPNSP